MKHELPSLPFAKDALSPVMSEETLNYHYGKHHKAYVDKLNQLVVGTEFENSTLEEIVLRSNGPIFNNAGQVWNHTFFWNSLSPQRQELKGDLENAIQTEFGSFENFKNKFIEVGVGQFGSGWAWLIKNQNGKLSIQSSSNAENPLRSGGTPLVTCDLWEHAYYIDYRNERPRYLKAFFEIINWDFAAQNFQKTGAKQVA